MSGKIELDGRKEKGLLPPEKELKCVWMTAGLISYKLCKYDLQCDRCPLDWELRNVSLEERKIKNFFRRDKVTSNDRQSDDVKEGAGTDELGCEGRPDIKEWLFYHIGHTWVKVEKADEVRIGIDDFLARLLLDVSVVIPPIAGSRGARGEHLCSIIQHGGILHTVFPVTGSVLSVNSKLKDNADLIRRDPLGEGYLLTLRPKNFQKDQRYLVYGTSAIDWYKRECTRLKEAFKREFVKDNFQDGLGVTLHDGGSLIGEIKNLMEPGRYVQFVSNFLRDGEKLVMRNKNRSSV